MPLTAAAVCAKWSEPSRALAAETLNPERTLSDVVIQADGLTPAEIELLWKTAPPRMPVPPPAMAKGFAPAGIVSNCPQSRQRLGP